MPKLLKKINTLEEPLKNREQELKLALAEKHKLHNQLKKLRDQLKEMAPNQPERTEQVVRKELLGLKGELKYVGILLDRSSSMKNDDRWEESIKVVETWLRHLPIENCFLITYNHTFNAFPANQYLHVSGPNEESNRNWLIQQIRDIQPTGETHIIEALGKAYKYPNLQTIILFTDGEPRL